MKVSMIISTFNRSRYIVGLLRQLGTFYTRNYEVIVVNDDSVDDTKEQLGKANWSIPHLRIIHQSNRGRASARSAGAEASLTDKLIFFDDDVSLSPELIESHIAKFDDYDIVQGLVF